MSQHETILSTGLTIKELFVDHDCALIKRTLSEFRERGYQYCNPLAQKYLANLAVAHADLSCGWFWWAEHGDHRWILSMDVDCEPFGELANRGFADWLEQFNPQDCNDWLLAPRLYNLALILGEPDWNGIRTRQCHKESEILSTSRGLLAWEYQYRFLIMTADDSIPSYRANELISGYRRHQPEALQQLENIPIGRRSIRAVFDDHSDYFLGTPNYFASGLLSRQY